MQRLFETRRRLRELKNWRSEDRKLLDSGNPKVSVMLITYNHERYVAEALDSILMQKRDFDIEINVIDDASTDKTQEIVRKYELQHPGIINCYFNARNIGHIQTQLNTIRGFQTLRGEYFALLEGDDYWTDENKISDQVRFLDANNSFVACAHWTNKVYDDGRPSEHFLPFKAFGRDIATMQDLVRMAGVFHLSSIVYRNVFELTPPAAFADPYSCEVTINMTYGLFGDFYCIDRCMSAYRVHEQGVFSGRSLEQHWLFHLHGFRHFALYLGRAHWDIFARAVVGFSRYVLSAPKRGEVTHLTWKAQFVFWGHLIAAAPFFLYAALRWPRITLPRLRFVLQRPEISLQLMKERVVKKWPTVLVVYHWLRGYRDARHND